jgi:hypothetical protein
MGDQAVEVRRCLATDDWLPEDRKDRNELLEDVSQIQCHDRSEVEHKDLGQAGQNPDDLVQQDFQHLGPNHRGQVETAGGLDQAYRLDRHQTLQDHTGFHNPLVHREVDQTHVQEEKTADVAAYAKDHYYVHSFARFLEQPVEAASTNH